MFDLIATMAARAAGNDVFAAGLALGLFGIAVAMLGRVWASVLGFAWRRLSVELSLDSRTSAHRHMTLWLDATGVLARARRKRVTGYLRADGAPLLAPDLGRHVFVRDGQLCLLTAGRDEKAVPGRGPLETYSAVLLGARPWVVLDWLDEGRRLAEAEAAIGPALHVFADGYWDACGHVLRRGVETFVSEGGVETALLADLRRFYGARDWYADRGVPWRRGILLFGPPGTGKSSLIRVLASELDRGVAVLDVGRRGMTDEGLREAMVRAPEDAILAIEDIDAVFAGREAAREGEGVSFSGLLNAIDGVGAQEGRALIMTTNHPERLDPALIRPGRADVHAELGPIGAVAVARMFARFHPGAAEVAEVGAVLGDTRLAPADVQARLLAAGDDPAAALAALRPEMRVAAE